MGEEHDLYEKYTNVSEVTNYLGEHHSLLCDTFWGNSVVFWVEEAYQKSPIIQEKIKSLVSLVIFGKCLIQFWAPKVVGNRSYLTTSDQPFAVDGLYKGLCWYRNRCMDNGDIIVDEGAKEEELGAVGRVYLNGYPESSPDLRLYSTQELPLRDYAARLYFVLPVFDLHNKECYGVLECLGFSDVWMGRILVYMEDVERALKTAELRTTHLKTDTPQEYIDQDDGLENPIKGVTERMPRYEITKMLKEAKQMIPQLHMAQVWIPCKQCANTTTGFCCMELLDSRDRIFQDDDMTDYLGAGKFHRLQLRKGIIAKTVMPPSNVKSWFCRNICDFSQSENPLAHYSQKSRLSFCFATCLESLHDSNHLYYVEFFLQPNSRRDPSGVSLCHLLIGVMKTLLKSFKVTSSDMLEVRKDMLSNSIELVPHNMSGILKENHQYSKKPNNLMNRCSEMYPSELEFQEDNHFSCFKSHRVCPRTWLFWRPERGELCENDENYSSFLQNSTQEKIKRLLNNLISRLFNSLVQFWEPIMIEGRWCLSTSEQTFALSGLHKGLAFFRKQCMEHHYFVDEGLNEEGHGPIERVFRSCHPETTHNVSLYSTTEFPLKNDAALWNLRSYIAFPLFDHHHKCLGVLEFVGICENITDALECIQKEVKGASVHLSSANISYNPEFQASFAPALGEIKEAFRLVNKISQLHLMKVWVPHDKCVNNNNSFRCVQQVPINGRDRKLPCVVETGKGIVGKVLASENKCCYCKNSCQLSIIEQSLSHHAQRKRLDVCFAICLQSSHIGDLPFVLNFFLNQGPGDCEYLWSFLYFLLPILKQKLKSFKVAPRKTTRKQVSG